MKLFYSEEDYGQIELLPACNLAGINRKMAHPSLFPYRRIELSELKIPVVEYRNIIEAVLPHVPQIFSYDGIICDDIFANAENDKVVFFHEVVDKYLSTIWLILDIGTEQAYKAAFDVLRNIRHLGALILVDWGWSQIVNLNNDFDLDEYLKKRLRIFRKL